MIYGEVNGIKRSCINELERLHNVRMGSNVIVEESFLKSIAEISLSINREICIVISRSGIVHNISVGNELEVKFQMDFKERKKLSGYRVIHTHLNSSCKLSDADIASLKNLNLDMISAVNVTDEKLLEGFSIGFLNFDSQEGYSEILFSNSDKYFNFDIYSIVQEIEKNMKIELHGNKFIETAVLIGCDSKESLQELKELVYACDIKVSNTFFQKRDKIDNKHYIGKGKLHEILRSIYHANVDILIFDEELSPSHVSNLEEISKIKVLDRTELILEIFARRAKSKISKYQVELAQLKYRYSKLKGLGLVLNRTGGGIGTRGPGEKKLETDRRHIKNRMNYLQHRIEDIKSEQSVQRKLRVKNKIPQVSIVGYTNAGKSTLRNYIYSIYGNNISENKFVYEDDMLFATLDTTTRRIILPDKTEISLTDTVGFIKRLPHDLVEAFKSTLEEIVLSDLIIHVVDVSSEDLENEIVTTDIVLRELGLKNFNKIFVFNKIDKLDNKNKEFVQNTFRERYGDDVVFISATQRINIDLLLKLISHKLNKQHRNISISVPYEDYSVLSSIYENYVVFEEKHLEDCTVLNFNIREDEIKKYEKYIVNDLGK